MSSSFQRNHRVGWKLPRMDLRPSTTPLEPSKYATGTTYG